MPRCLDCRRFSYPLRAFQFDGLLEITHRKSETAFQVDFWFPAQLCASDGNVRTALLRIILWQRLKSDSTLGAGHLQHQPGTIQDGELVRVSDIHGSVNVRPG